jgi:transposase-like protein
MTRPIDNTTKQRIVRMAMQGYSRKEIAQSGGEEADEGGKGMTD